VYAPTIEGMRALAQGNTSNGMLFSQHNFINDFPGSESQGVPASDTTPQSAFCNIEI